MWRQPGATISAKRLAIPYLLSAEQRSPLRLQPRASTVRSEYFFLWPFPLHLDFLHPANWQRQPPKELPPTRPLEATGNSSMLPTPSVRPTRDGTGEFSPTRNNRASAEPGLPSRYTFGNASPGTR